MARVGLPGNGRKRPGRRSGGVRQEVGDDRARSSPGSDDRGEVGEERIEGLHHRLELVEELRSAGSPVTDAVISGSRFLNRRRRLGARRRRSRSVGLRSRATGFRSRNSGPAFLAKPSRRSSVSRRLPSKVGKILKVSASASSRDASARKVWLEPTIAPARSLVVARSGPRTRSRCRAPRPRSACSWRRSVAEHVARVLREGTDVAERVVQVLAAAVRSRSLSSSSTLEGLRVSLSSALKISSICTCSATWVSSRWPPSSIGSTRRRR